MIEKLSLFDRRMEILSMMKHSALVTRSSLAKEFSVSKVTITEDINALSRYVPICSKPGKYGGIYLLEDYRGNKEYLSSDEQELLQEYLHRENEERQLIIEHILLKFAMPTQDNNHKRRFV